jgi:phosphate uptake regulator
VERIGDCATNIAEDVIYLVEGEIARHHFDNLHQAM